MLLVESLEGEEAPMCPCFFQGCSLLKTMAIVVVHTGALSAEPHCGGRGSEPPHPRDIMGHKLAA